MIVHHQTLLYNYSSWRTRELHLCLWLSEICQWRSGMYSGVQGANRAAEDAERERRDREDRLRHGRNPAARGMPSASSRPRGTQEVAPPTPLTPTSHTGECTEEAMAECQTGSNCTWNNPGPVATNGRFGCELAPGSICLISLISTFKELYYIPSIIHNPPYICSWHRKGKR